MEVINQIKSATQISFDIRVAPEELHLHRKQALGMLSAELEIPGFRKGHVPEEVAKQHIGEDTLFQKTFQRAIQQAAQDLVSSQNIEFIGQPQVTILKAAPGNPFEFRISFAMIPKFELGDWKKIRVKPERPEVKAEEVEQALVWLQKSRAKGQTLPELNDDFARSLGSFENLEALRQSIRVGILAEKELQEKQRVRLKALEDLVAQAKGDVPEVLIEKELETMLEELRLLIARQGLKLEDYLAKVGKDLEQLKKDLRAIAAKRLKAALLIRQIAAQENLEASEEEIKEKANEILARYRSLSQAKKAIDPESLKAYTREIIINEKVLDLIEKIATST